MKKMPQNWGEKKETKINDYLKYRDQDVTGEGHGDVGGIDWGNRKGKFGAEVGHGVADWKTT